MKRFVLSLVFAAVGCASGELMRYVSPDTETDLAFVPATPERTQLGNGLGVLTSTFEHPATTTLATFVPLRGFGTATVLVGTSVPSHPTSAVPIVVGAASGRSNHVMRELTQKTYGAHPAVLDDGPLSLWSVTARVPPNDAKDAAGFMMHSFGTVKTVTEQQLDYSTTRNVAAAYAQRSLATVHLLRLREAFERGYTFPVGAPFQTLPTLPGPEQVMRAYRKHFLVKHLHVVIVGDPDVIGPQLKNMAHVVRTPEEILGPQRPAHEEAPAPSADVEGGRGTISPWEAETAGG